MPPCLRFRRQKDMFTIRVHMMPVRQCEFGRELDEYGKPHHQELTNFRRGDPCDRPADHDHPHDRDRLCSESYGWRSWANTRFAPTNTRHRYCGERFKSASSRMMCRTSAILIFSLIFFNFADVGKIGLRSTNHNPQEGGRDGFVIFVLSCSYSLNSSILAIQTY